MPNTNNKEEEQGRRTRSDAITDGKLLTKFGHRSNPDMTAVKRDLLQRQDYMSVDSRENERKPRGQKRMKKSNDIATTATNDSEQEQEQDHYAGSSLPAQQYCDSQHLQLNRQTAKIVRTPVVYSSNLSTRTADENQQIRDLLMPATATCNEPRRQTTDSSSHNQHQPPTQSFSVAQQRESTALDPRQSSSLAQAAYPSSLDDRQLFVARLASNGFLASTGALQPGGFLMHGHGGVPSTFAAPTSFRHQRVEPLSQHHPTSLGRTTALDSSTLHPNRVSLLYQQFTTAPSAATTLPRSERPTRSDLSPLTLEQNNVGPSQYFFSSNASLGGATKSSDSLSQEEVHQQQQHSPTPLVYTPDDIVAVKSSALPHPQSIENPLSVSVLQPRSDSYTPTERQEPVTASSSRVTERDYMLYGSSLPSFVPPGNTVPLSDANFSVVAAPPLQRGNSQLQPTHDSILSSRKTTKKNNINNSNHDSSIPFVSLTTTATAAESSNGILNYEESGRSSAYNNRRNIVGSVLPTSANTPFVFHHHYIEHPPMELHDFGTLQHLTPSVHTTDSISLPERHTCPHDISSLYQQFATNTLPPSHPCTKQTVERQSTQLTQRLAPHESLSRTAMNNNNSNGISPTLRTAATLSPNKSNYRNSRNDVLGGGNGSRTIPFDSATLAAIPSSQASVAMSLYLPLDSFRLSEYQVLIRKQLEIFEAQEKDTESTSQGRKTQIHVGQVGIRCRHCAHIPFGGANRGRGSVYYPSRLSKFYQAAQNMASTHLSESCVAIDARLQVELRWLRATKQTASGGIEYWAAGAKALGCYDTNTGVRRVSTTA